MASSKPDKPGLNNSEFELLPQVSEIRNTHQSIEDLRKKLDNLKDSLLHTMSTNNETRDKHYSQENTSSSDAVVEMGTSVSNTMKPKYANPFHETNPFRMDPQDANSSLSFIDPFAEDFVATSNNPFLPGHSQNNEIVKGTDIANCAGSLNTEHIFFCELSGENLGMVLGIEGDQDNRRTIDAVVVKSVTPGGPVDKTCEGNKVQVGDEIREVNRQSLTELTHDECVAFFQNLPENIILTVCRKQKDTVNNTENRSSSHDYPRTPMKRKGPPMPLTRKHVIHEDSHQLSQNKSPEEVVQFELGRSSDDSHLEGFPMYADFSSFKVPKGFNKLDLTFIRGEKDSLGVSIVPSYGATRDLYQIKRLVSSGVCAQSGQLEVGDRLLICNDQSLKGLTQAQCLQVLKSSGNQVRLSVLRCLTSDREQTPEVQHIAGEDNLVSENYHQAVSVSSSASLINTDIPKHLEQGNDILEQPCLNSLDIINNQTTQLQASIEDDNTAHGNIDQSVELKEIRLLDSEKLYALSSNYDIVNKEDIQWNESLITEKSSDTSLYLPPPADFSDFVVLQGSEVSNNNITIPLKVTNIDELLCETHEHNQNFTFNDSGFDALGSPDTNDNKLQHKVQSEPEETVLISDITPTDLSYTDFTAQSLEEFAEECFGSIGAGIDDVKQIKNFCITHSSEPVDIHQIKSVSDNHDQEVPNTISNNTAVTHVLPYDSSEKYITKIPLSAEEKVEGNSNVHESELSQLKSYTDYLLDGNTSTTVQSHYTDAVPNESYIQEQIAPPFQIGRDSFVIFENNETSSPFFVTLPTQNQNTMSDQQQEPKPLTTVGVTTTCQHGQEEETVQPMIAVRDSQGSSLCVPSQQPLSATAAQINEPRTLDGRAKEEMANMLSLIFKSPSELSQALLTSVAREAVCEQEIVPELLTYDQKEMVLNVLSHWSDLDNSKKTNAFQKLVSDVIDVQIQSDQHARNENPVYHSVPCNTSKTAGESLLQPVESTKIHADTGTMFTASSQPEISIEEDAIASSIASQTGLSLPAQIAGQPENLISKVEKSQSTNQKHNDTNILINVDASESAKTVEDQISELIKDHQDKNMINLASHNLDKFTSKVQEPNVDSIDSSLNLKSSTVIVETFQIPSENTEHHPNKALNVVSEKSTRKPDQVHDTTVVVQKEEKLHTEIHNKVNMFEQLADISPSKETDTVVMRQKTKQSTDFKAKIDSFQQPQPHLSVSSSVMANSRRPRSMIDTSPAKSASKFDGTHKPFTTEIKSRPLFRPLSAVRPLSASTTSLLHLNSALSSRPASGTFSGSTFTTRSSKTDYPKTRQENGSPFQVDVLKGIVGLGIKVKVTPEGHVQIVEIQRGGPIDKDGHIRVGDYLLFINSTEMTGQTDARVQQVLRLLPRGLTKLIVSCSKPSPLTETQQVITDKDSLKVKLSSQPEHQQMLGVKSSNTYQTADLLTSPNKNELALSVKAAVAPTVGASQAQLSEKIEQESFTNVSESAPDTTVKKPVPVQRSKHDPVIPKAIPRHISENISEKDTPIDHQDSRNIKSVDAKVDTVVEKHSEKELKLGSKNQAAFDKKIEMFEHKATVSQTSGVPPKSKTDHTPSVENTSVLDRKQALSSPTSSPKVPISSVDHEKIEITSTKGIVHEEKLEPMKGKVAPPVAPKPRMGISNLIKSQESLKGSELAKTSLEPHDTIKTPLSPTASARHVSKSEVLYNDIKQMKNTSTEESQRIERSTGNLISHSTSVSQSAAVPLPPLTRPRTLISTETSSKEILHPARSASSKESPDDKSIKIHATQAHLNSALSPRKSGSFDSPSSPSLTFSSSNSSIFKDKSVSQQHSNGKNHSSELSNDIITTVPVQIPASQVSLKAEFSPNLDQSPDTVTSRNQTNDNTSFIQVSSNSTQEKNVHDAVKKFDDLLIDVTHESTITDLQDILLLNPTAVTNIVFPTTACSETEIDTISMKTKSGAGKEKAEGEIKGKMEKEREVRDHLSNLITELELTEVKETEPIKEIVLSDILSSNEHKKIITEIINPVECEQSQTSYLTSTQDVSNEASKKHEILNKTEKEINQTPENIQVLEKLLGHDQDFSMKATPDLREAVESCHEIPHECIQESIHLHSNQPDVTKEEHADEKTDGNESLSRRRRGYYSNRDVIFVENEKFGQYREDESDFNSWKSQASELVENIMSKINFNPMMLFQQEKVETTDETDNRMVIETVENNMSKVNNNSIVFSQLDKMETTDETNNGKSFEDEPPPLPGAPPPPLILRDAKLLVNSNDLIDQSGSPVVPGTVSDLLQEQELNQSSVNLQHSASNSSSVSEVHKDEKACVTGYKLDVSEQINLMEVNSEELLVSPGDSSYHSDSAKLSSPNLLDLLSEDSGVTVDDDKEMDTDDSTSIVEKLRENHSNLQAESPNVATQGIADFEDASENYTNLTTVKNFLDEDIINVNQPVPLIPTTTASPPNYITLPTNTSLTKDISSQISSSTIQGSNYLAQPADALLHVDDVSVNESKVLPINGSHLKSQSVKKSDQKLEIDISNDDQVPSSGKVQHHILSETIQWDTFTSKRKSILISSISKHEASNNVTLHVDSKEKNYAASLPLEVLTAHLDRANTVLDAMSATDTLVLMVVHIQKNEGCQPLGVDLKQEGDSCFKVSDITEGSPLLEDDRVHIGDWMLAVDELWCDQAKLPDFVSRLAEYKHNWLFVLARKDELEDISETKPSRPIPSPRPRSVHKQQVTDEILHDNGHSDATSELIQVEEPVVVSIEDKPVAKERQHKPLETEHGNDQHSNHLDKNSEKNIFPSEEMSSISTFSKETTPNLQNEAILQSQKTLQISEIQPDHALSFSHTPQLLDKAEPSFNTLDSSEPRTDQTSTHSEEAPPPLPERAPPDVCRSPEASEIKPEPVLLHFEESSLEISEPKSNETLLHSAKVSSMIDQALKKEAQTSLEKTESPLFKKSQESVKSTAALISHENTSVSPKNTTGMHIANGEKTREFSEGFESAHAKTAPVNDSDSLPKAVSAKTLLNEDLPTEKVIQNPAGSSDELGPGIHKVIMIKGATGVGFCLEGGVGSPKGDVPITIKRIFKGGPAEKCGQLKVKDEILEVNGLKFAPLRHFEAWNHLKFVDDGEVHITIHRY